MASKLVATACGAGLWPSIERVLMKGITVNERTAKLLKKWATETSEQPRLVRREWLKLTALQRTAKRKEIRERLAE